MRQRSHFVAGEWTEGAGEPFASRNPADGTMTWEGRAATAAEVDGAVAAARDACGGWAARPLQERIGFLEIFGERVRREEAGLAEAISRETGKPLWESRTEAGAMVAKIALIREAYAERCAPGRIPLGKAVGGVLHRPLGVVGVLGPFNLPGHLPNGHIVPALLAGNTVVLKPSEQTPLVGQLTAELWETAGLPPGVFNLVQGAAATGSALTGHPDLDGLFFTGSYRTGCALHRALAGRPEVMLALEMGGNNPLLVWDVADLDAAAVHVVLSAFITAGQRCTCARRLILPSDRRGEALLVKLEARISAVRVGPYTDPPEPFMGPVISPGAAEQLLEAQADLSRRGGKVLVEMKSLGQALLSPGVIDVTGVRERPDVELFGPLLQVIRVPDFDAALGEADRTGYGLAAGILTDDGARYELFRDRVRAGVIHWNRQTTGASGRLPFGGLGQSGNHRPGGFFAVDYCSDPVATLEVSLLGEPESLPPGLG